MFVLQRFLYFQHQFETWHLKYLKKQKRSQKSPTPFLLLLIIVYWRAETQCWSKKSVNFMQVLPSSVNVQTMVHRSIYSFDSDVLRKKRESCESISFQHIDIRLWLLRRFHKTLRENSSSLVKWSNKPHVREQMLEYSRQLYELLSIFIKKWRSALNTSENFFQNIEIITARRIKFC